MNFKMTTFKQVAAVALLLSLAVGSAGCGCNDDSTLALQPFQAPSVGGVRSQAPPVPVPFNTTPQPLRIDIAFLLDDSDTMVQAQLGLIPANPGDRRERSQAAQAIMRNLEQTVRTRLEAEYAAEEMELPELDFAYGVARYEDFGGPFTSPNRDADDGDIDSFRNDLDARPFILNMPILRQNLPEFDALFTAALARTAPGDGNPISSVPTVDAQSGIEALWQMAAPDPDADGIVGGFDADGSGDTLGSGTPTSLDPLLNPQTKPGATGDVPAITFLKQVADDADGHPLYWVGDETGAVVKTPAPDGAVTIASGDLGGMGWRRDSARFVIVASDIATVAPTETEPLGEIEFGATLPTPSDAEAVISKAGDATPTGAPRPAPRTAKSALLRAFDSGHRLSPFLRRRIGVADGPVHAGGTGVAPVGAHTVQETIDALNELDIEILSMGAPFPGPADTKPGVSGVNGDEDADIGEYDVVNPLLVRPEIAPWRWFTAITRLTTPEVTSVPPPPLAGEELYPAVYNFGTIWPFNAADAEGTDTSTIKATIVDDLIERIRDWVDTPYLQPPMAPIPLHAPLAQVAGRPDPLPTLNFLVTLDLEWPADEMNIRQTNPVENGIPTTHFETTVVIPVYWDDQPAPADVLIDFPSFTFSAADDTVPLPATVLVPFKMTANFVDFGSRTPENEHLIDLIIAYVKERGNGTDFNAGEPVPLGTETELYVQAEGTLLITVRSTADGGPRVQLVTYDKGSFIVNDLSIGQSAADQVGGSGEAFPPPLVK